MFVGCKRGEANLHILDDARPALLRRIVSNPRTEFGFTWLSFPRPTSWGEWHDGVMRSGAWD